jgi:DNA polymerase III subunit delta
VDKLDAVPSFKPAYLIAGDDHGRIAERRARLRALAERESGAGGLEVLDGDAGTPAAAAAALAAMTLSPGRRFIVVEGVERWKDGELAPLEQALRAVPPDTTIAFFAREDSRASAPGRLGAAVEAAGGDVAHERTLKAWELPKWVAARARELELELDPGAAGALIAQVGERQQRLLRELEKLRLELGAGARLDADAVDALAAPSAERRAWTLADALVARDAAAALRTYEALTAQGERIESLVYHLTRRVREALGVAERLEAGESPAQVKRSLRMPGKAADQLIADVRGSELDALRQAIEALADLELETRRSRDDEKPTLAVRTILRIAA